MGYKSIEGPNRLEIRVPRYDGYRACGVCGGDYLPKPSGADDLGMCVALVGSEDGVRSIVGSFEEGP